MTHARRSGRHLRTGTDLFSWRGAGPVGSQLAGRPDSRHQDLHGLAIRCERLLKAFFSALRSVVRVQRAARKQRPEATYLDLFNWFKRFSDPYTDAGGEHRSAARGGVQVDAASADCRGALGRRSAADRGLLNL